jgi:hypothetical protein
MQPELPLERPAPASASTSDPIPGSAGGEEWRLDEETRRIGQRGIAAARAALAAPRSGHADATDPRGDQRSGRAA